jgi:hypothetical protein
LASKSRSIHLLATSKGSTDDACADDADFQVRSIESDFAFAVEARMNG